MATNWTDRVKPTTVWDSDDDIGYIISQEDDFYILQENGSLIVAPFNGWSLRSIPNTVWDIRTNVLDWISDESQYQILQEDGISYIGDGEITWNIRTKPTTNWVNRIKP